MGADAARAAETVTRRLDAPGMTAKTLPCEASDWVRVTVSLLVCFSLLFMGSAAMAQNQSTKVEDGLDAAEQDRKQHKQLLDILTAENGTNPTAIVGRFQLSNTYRNLAKGAERNDTTFRIDLPVTPNWLLRADVSAGWVEPNQPGISDTFGVNDLFLRTAWRVYQSPDFSLLVGADAIFPTATDTQLGRGKYEIGPGMAASVPIPSLKSTLLSVAQHFVSVGGDPSRPDVDFSALQFQLNTVWSKEWWTLLEGDLNVDWTRGAKTGAVFEGEVGRRFGHHWRAWVRPGAGLWGQDVRGTYDWSVQLGIRYMFYVY